MLHEKQIAVLNGLLLEQDEKQSKEKAGYLEELTKQLNANSQIQSDTFSLMKSFDKERRSSALSSAAFLILERSKKVKLNRMSEMFRVWNTNSTLVGAAAQFRTQMTELVRTTLGECRREKETSLEILRIDLEVLHMEREKDLRVEFDSELDAVKEAGATEITEMKRCNEEELIVFSDREKEERDLERTSIRRAHDAVISVLKMNKIVIQ